MNDGQTVAATTPPIVRVREARMVYGPTVRPKPPAIGHSRDLATFLRGELGSSMVERFAVVALDARHRPQCWGVVAVGSQSDCPVPIAEILRFVLLAGCVTFAVSHNHPSGDATPSDADVEATKRIADGARACGLRLLDHVVVSDTSHVSFVDTGLLTQ